MTNKPRAQKSHVEEDKNEIEVMMEKMLENLLTAQEAAELLGIDESRVRLLCEQNRIAAVKKGHAWIVYKPSVVKYMKTRRRGRPSGESQKTGT